MTAPLPAPARPPFAGSCRMDCGVNWAEATPMGPNLARISSENEGTSSGTPGFHLESRPSGWLHRLRPVGRRDDDQSRDAGSGSPGQPRPPPRRRSVPRSVPRPRPLPPRFAPGRPRPPPRPGCRSLLRSGPPSGVSSTVTYTYEFNGPAPSQTKDPFDELRGILKDVFASLGGGEKFIQAERAAWEKPEEHE